MQKHRIMFRTIDSTPSTLALCCFVVGLIQSESRQFSFNERIEDNFISIEIEAVFNNEEQATEVISTFKLKALTDHLVDLSIEKTTID